jgi:hypothetical protein
MVQELAQGIWPLFSIRVAKKQIRYASDEVLSVAFKFNQ